MQKNLNFKIAFIVAVLLLCVYGIIGLPKSKDELISNWKNNIKLGLDLRGGSHLVLQVQVQDAFKAEADQTIERIKEELRKASINFNTIDRNDPATLEEADRIQINIQGVANERTGDFRAIITERFPTWVMTPVNSTDYRLNLRPTEALTLRKDTVERSIRTIENRINQLGLTEPVIQQRGRAEAEGEILVQLPGVDDPARVKQIIQTAAMLEIAEVKDGPFPSQEAAPRQARRCVAAQYRVGAHGPARRIRRELVSVEPHRGHHRPRPAQCAARTGRVPQVGKPASR